MSTCSSHIINERPVYFLIMGHRGDLTVPEKATIISELTKGKTTFEISNILGRYQGTVEKFVAAPDAVPTR